jgi:hypothetical protein
MRHRGCSTRQHELMMICVARCDSLWERQNLKRPDEHLHKNQIALTCRYNLLDLDMDWTQQSISFRIWMLLDTLTT